MCAHRGNGSTYRAKREQAMRITAIDPQDGKVYLVTASRKTVMKYDNGALLSCGWRIGEDLPRGVFNRLQKEELPFTTYKHSGCTSRCTVRGDTHCQW
jgi:hypothetical protein